MTAIGDWAFSDNQLTSVTIPSSVTTIGSAAFAINQIAVATIPSTVTRLSVSTFAYQSNRPTFADDLSSGDPVKHQSALDSIFYTKVYTNDPSNPAGLKDQSYILDESIGQDWGCTANSPCPHDNNGDGDTTDTFNYGGYIVNPASLTTTYKDSTGKELSPTITAINSKPEITDYMAKTVPLTIDQTNGSTADTSSYYRLNQSISTTAPTIAGYATITPTSPHTMTLAAADNTLDFVYLNPGDTTSPASGSTTASSNPLAATGTNLIATAATALTIITVALTGLVVRQRYSRGRN